MMVDAVINDLRFGGVALAVAVVVVAAFCRIQIA